MNIRILLCALIFLLLASNRVYTADLAKLMVHSDSSEPCNPLQDELIQAIKSKNLERVQQLIAMPGININAYDCCGRTALCAALHTDNVELISLLVNIPEINFTLNDSEKVQDPITPLLFAASFGNRNTLERWIHKLTDVGSDTSLTINRQSNEGYTALMSAALMNNLENVRFLLTIPGIDVNHQADNGKTAIKLERERNNSTIKRLLLHAPGIILTRHTAEHSTPLIMLVKAAQASPERDLIKAAGTRNLEKVETLAQLPEINLNAHDSRGYTALMAAILGGHTSVVSFLLTIPALDINLPRYAGNPIPCSDHALVRSFLSSPEIDINAQDSKGNTALIKSIPDITMVSLLLEAGALVKIPNFHAKTALDYAHKDYPEDTALIDLLTTYKDKESDDEIITSARALTRQEFNKKDNPEHRKLLWKLTCSIRNGNTEKVQKVLAHPYLNLDTSLDANKNDRHLQDAIQYGHLAIVRALVARSDIDINQQNRSGESALICAAHKGSKDIVEALLQRADITINAQNRTGDTALKIALRNHSLDIAQILLERPDIDINIQDTMHGYTALAIAVEQGNVAITKALLKIPGILINTQDESGETPLMRALSRQRKEIFRLLIAMPDIKVNLQTKVGYTALMYVINTFFWPPDSSFLHEAISLLLKKGARVAITNKNNETVLDLILIHPDRFNMIELIDLLQDKAREEATQECMAEPSNP